MLEVLPKKRYLGHKWGVVDPGNKMIPYHQNTFCGALSVKPRSMDCSVQRPKELKKVRDVATSLLPPPYNPNVACLNYGMWGRVLDLINHAKF